MDRLYLLGRLVEAGVFLSLAFGAGWQGARWKYENQQQPIVSLGGKGDS